MKSDSKQKTTLKLAALAVGMFGFAYALVPIYEVFCEITGINGRSELQAALQEEINASAVREEREVRIEFIAKVARGLPWDMNPVKDEMIVKVGELNQTAYRVRSRANVTTLAQAVPSIAPGEAARYMRKLECFCFEQQELMPGGEMDMGVSFFIDEDLPADISQLTLSYTMFNLGEVEHDHMMSHED